MKNREIRTSNIPWCTHTWNPGVGCLRGCKYCYARGIMKRFLAKYYAEAEVEYFKTFYDVLSASMQKKIYNAVFHRLQEFKPTFLYSQTYGRKWFPLQPAVIFIDALSDISYWHSDLKCLKVDKDGKSVFFNSFNTEDAESTEGIFHIFDRVKEKMNKDHTFVVLTKDYATYSSLQIEFPENLILGFTMDHGIWAHVNLVNNLPALLLNTEYIHGNTRNRVMWSLEPMTVQDFSEFTLDTERRIDSGEWNRDALPDWVIYGPKTPNRKLITRDEKVVLLNTLDVWRELLIPVMVKGLKYGPGETPIQPTINAPVHILSVLKKWKGKEYYNH